MSLNSENLYTFLTFWHTFYKNSHTLYCKINSIYEITTTMRLRYKCMLILGDF